MNTLMTFLVLFTGLFAPIELQENKAECRTKDYSSKEKMSTEAAIPKIDFCLEFALNAVAVAHKARSLKNSIKKDQWEETLYLDDLYFNFYQGKKLKVCRLISRDIKALVKQADNKPPRLFLEELAQIFERYNTIEKIEKYSAKSDFIESAIAPYVLSPSQLEPILDQSLAKDDFLTTEEWREKKEADSTYRAELTRFYDLLNYGERRILNQLFNMAPLEEQLHLDPAFKYSISAKELIAFLKQGNTGHPLVRKQLIQQLANQLDSSKHYSIDELSTTIHTELSLSSSFRKELFCQEFYDVKKQRWINGYPPAPHELYPIDWLYSCFDAKLRHTSVRREVVVIQLKEEIKVWFKKLQPSINDPNIRNYCLSKKQWKAHIHSLFSASTRSGLKIPLLEDYFLSKIDETSPNEDYLSMNDFIKNVWTKFLGDKAFQQLDPFKELSAEEIKQLADSARVLLAPAKNWEKAIRDSRCQRSK
ncbi:hypothetical protein SapgrDRAFT_2801 [Saprospira grandis DSM 2844]|uniref:Uncharacterized protein n=1 Tax=Saprospira grandis DSM 2844 TaxID=694433 RepID=J0XZ48_9BACT|nr:hypothetical protein SapgrDRAFT_2801 [Saprospira grandis DSM 2844]